MNFGVFLYDLTSMPMVSFYMIWCEGLTYLLGWNKIQIYIFFSESVYFIFLGKIKTLFSVVLIPKFFNLQSWTFSAQFF